jgi:predicted NAD-dependent protein-ADP-ribosyltransferase YbiA (DUF1768 family)
MKAITFSNRDDSRVGFLSNESKHSFILDDKKWLTVEHYIQSKKFEGTLLEEEIRLAPTILMVKNLTTPKLCVYYDEKGIRQEKYIYGNKKNVYYIKDNWASLLKENMEKAIHAKFDQNPQLQKKLLETRNVSLIDLNNPLTGKILEDYRSSLRKQQNVHVKKDSIPKEYIFDVDITLQDLSEIQILFYHFYKILEVIAKYEGWNKIKEEMVEDVVLICVPQKLKKNSLKYIRKFSKIDSCVLFNSLPNTNKFLVETELFLHKKLKKNTEEEISDIGLLITAFFKWLCYISTTKENAVNVKIIIQKLNLYASKPETIYIPKVKRSYRLLEPPHITPGSGKKLTGTEIHYRIDRFIEKKYACIFILKCIVQNKGEECYNSLKKLKTYILEKKNSTREYITKTIYSTDDQLKNYIDLFGKYKPKKSDDIIGIAKFIKNCFPGKDESLTAFEVHNIISDIYDDEKKFGIEYLSQIEDAFGEEKIIPGIKKKSSRSRDDDVIPEKKSITDKKISKPKKHDKPHDVTEKEKSGTKKKSVVKPPTTRTVIFEEEEGDIMEIEEARTSSTKQKISKDFNVMKEELEKDFYMIPVRNLIEKAVETDTVDSVTYGLIKKEYERLEKDMKYEKDDYIKFIENILSLLENIHVTPTIKRYKDGKLLISGLYVRDVAEKLSRFQPRFLKQKNYDYKKDPYRIIIPPKYSDYYEEINSIVHSNLGSDQSKIEHEIDNIVKTKMLDLLRCSYFISKNVLNVDMIVVDSVDIYLEIIKCKNIKSYKSPTYKNYLEYNKNVIDKNIGEVNITDEAKEYISTIYSKLMDMFYILSENKTYSQFMGLIRSFSKKHSPKIIVNSLPEDYNCILSCVVNIYKIIYGNSTPSPEKLLNVSGILLSKEGFEEVSNLFNRYDGIDDDSTEEDLLFLFEQLRIPFRLDTINLNEVFGPVSNTIKNKFLLYLILTRVKYNKSLKRKIDIICC